MDIVQQPDRLDLHNDTPLDQKISDKVTYENILVTNFDPVLLCNLDANLPEFYSEGILVNLFKKSGSKDIADLMHAANNSFGDLVQP